jgi:ABC-type polysaccharide/polyol phosphate export permease
VNEVVRGCCAIVQRDARAFWSYRWRPLKELLGATFAVALFYELARLIANRRFPSPKAYFDFAVVGLAFLPLLRSGIVAPIAAVREELIAGTLERLALSAMGLCPCLLATLAFPFGMSILSGALILLFASAFFGLHLTLLAALLAIPVAVLAALALAPFAALLLAASVLVKQVGSGSGWILAGLSLLGGVYFPVALLPTWIRWASDIMPLAPALDLLRNVLVGTPLEASLTVELGTLAAFGAVGLTAAGALLGAACDHARRRGTLLEY